ncbi:hypothetical protein CYMTET_43766 [Cymbomonas tetramitiformis]|uniref:Uncharacterized protein n=1 Tax=Cymbomonas tetramitiformis TaxID=36881 RepID=A0AAE0C2R3_9CHLO|nr:hypothetical protein CYMTET_43766 [Cymbomonas tetramitiformis]
MDHGAALAIKAREYAELHAFDGFNDEDRAMPERIQASNERRRSERLAALEQEGTLVRCSFLCQIASRPAGFLRCFELLLLENVANVVFWSSRHNDFERHGGLGNTTENACTVTNKLNFDIGHLGALGYGELLQAVLLFSGGARTRVALCGGGSALSATGSLGSCTSIADALASGTALE